MTAVNSIDDVLDSWARVLEDLRHEADRLREMAARASTEPEFRRLLHQAKALRQIYDAASCAWPAVTSSIGVLFGARRTGVA